MRHCLVLVLLIFGLTSAANTNNPAETIPLSFAAWKESKKKGLEAERESIEKKLIHARLSREQTRQLRESLIHLKWSAEANEKLGVTEYLNLYVAKQKNIDIRLIAVGLADDEVAQLIREVMGSREGKRIAESNQSRGHYKKLTALSE